MNHKFTVPDKKTEFSVFCIEMYADRHGISGKDAAVLFSRSGILQYLDDCYGLLHTQSREWLMRNIENYLKHRGEI